MKIEKAACPQCHKETLEQRYRKDRFGRDFSYILCRNCNHEPNLYDEERQRLAKEKGKQK